MIAPIEMKRGLSHCDLSSVESYTDCSEDPGATSGVNSNQQRAKRSRKGKATTEQLADGNNYATPTTPAAPPSSGVVQFEQLSDRLNRQQVVINSIEQKVDSLAVLLQRICGFLCLPIHTMPALGPTPTNLTVDCPPGDDVIPTEVEPEIPDSFANINSQPRKQEVGSHTASLSTSELNKDSDAGGNPLQIRGKTKFGVSAVAHPRKLRSNVAGTVKRNSNISDMIFEAIDRENNYREQRAKSVIITGLPERSDADADAPQVLDLLNSEFDFVPTRIYCKRLGNPSSDKPRLLRVSFQASEEAAWLVSVASRLRKSHDSAVRNNIFINRNLTFQERTAAFLARQRRREVVMRNVDSRDLGPMSDGLGGHSRVFTNSTRSGGIIESSAPVCPDITDGDQFPALPSRRESSDLTQSRLVISRSDYTGVHLSDSVLLGTVDRSTDNVHPIDADHPISVSSCTGVHPVDGILSSTGVHPNDSVHPFDNDTGAHPIDGVSGHSVSVSVSRLSADAPAFDYVSGGLSVAAENEGRP